MRILLAGGSGAIGLPLVHRLRAAGHDVTAVHRSASGRETLRAAGAAPVQVDVLDRSALRTATDGRRFDVVVAQLTALKKLPMRHTDFTATNRLRTEGTANLLDVARRTGARRFLTQSMVFGYGYGDFGSRVLTEADPFAPPGRGRFEDTWRRCARTSSRCSAPPTSRASRCGTACSTVRARRASPWSRACAGGASRPSGAPA